LNKWLLSNNNAPFIMEERLSIYHGKVAPVRRRIGNSVVNVTEMLFSETRIWRQSFGPNAAKGNADSRNRLRDALLRFRERAAHLAAEISRQQPEMTVHDISHLDALWEMADLIYGNQEKLNPCEAFVLGGAFLLHDLGMCPAAYPGGGANLLRHPLFGDFLAELVRERLGRPASESEIQMAPESDRQQAIGQVLRSLHAEIATGLLDSIWRDPIDGSETYLLEDSELRHAFGPIIGKIAASHWWPVSRFSAELADRLGAPIGFPREWTVDAIKVACLLRLADASHIDARRAPKFLFALRQPTAESRKHWDFQVRVHQPTVEKDRLVYTSGQGFSVADYESWWLCFETLKKVDEELRQVDALLSDL
jgi:hypothetical protein